MSIGVMSLIARRPKNSLVGQFQFRAPINAGSEIQTDPLRKFDISFPVPSRFDIICPANSYFKLLEAA
jgi:hypothetical protein